MHLNFGWDGIGYHKIINRYGKVENGKRVRVLIKSHKECQIQSKFLFRDT